MSENNGLPTRAPRSTQDRIRRPNLADAAGGFDGFVPLDWIKDSGASVSDALMKWDAGELAVIPVGRVWDVVRMPRPVGWRTVQQLRNVGATLGPVLHNETHVEVLVPAGSVADWDLPSASVGGVGETISVPHPSIVAPHTQHARSWIVPPKGLVFTDGTELYSAYAAAVASMEMDAAR